MHAWEVIQNSLNYIEEHLSENIKIETLANVAALSYNVSYNRVMSKYMDFPVKRDDSNQYP